MEEEYFEHYIKPATKREDKIDEQGYWRGITVAGILGGFICAFALTGSWMLEAIEKASRQQAYVIDVNNDGLYDFVVGNPSSWEAYICHPGGKYTRSEEYSSSANNKMQSRIRQFLQNQNL